MFKALADPTRRAILARRASFIAAAMASLAADGCTKPEKSADAGIAVETLPTPADADVAPLLAPPVMAPSALAPPPSASATTTARPKPTARPHACLKVPPRPCLKVAPGERDDF